LIAAVVQHDDPNGSKSFWRRRPISAPRLLSAKLIMLFGVSVGVSFIALVLVQASVEWRTKRKPPAPGGTGGLLQIPIRAGCSGAEDAPPAYGTS